MARYRFEDIDGPLIREAPNEASDLVICIPCYNESNLQATLDSIYDCDPIHGQVEVIILINEAVDCDEAISETNLSTYEVCVEFNKSSRGNIKLYPIYVDAIPSKKAGVGLARKLAMDEASARLLALDKERGVIVCLDADTTVQENYLQEITNFFATELKYDACSISFAHDKATAADITTAICQYESHLRAFINLQRLIRLPYAFQTVGSAMAITAKTYQKLGGMNTRKAGEDFYFLHKFIKNGLVKDLSSTCVYPSPRVSDRVPFGTGKAVGDLLQHDEGYLSYHPKSFECIEAFIDLLPKFYEEDQVDLKLLTSLDSSLVSYLNEQKFDLKLAEIKKHTSTYAAFAKRFFDWFDAFRLMKCLHHLRDEKYPNVPVGDAIKTLFEKLGLDYSDDDWTNLETLRDYDRASVFPGLKMYTS